MILGDGSMFDRSLLDWRSTKRKREDDDRKRKDDDQKGEAERMWEGKERSWKMRCFMEGGKEEKRSKEE